MDLDTLVDDFAFFDDWEGRYQYLIDLGERLPPMADADKTDANRVRGCISKVWIKTYRMDGDPPRLGFDADSDSSIVRGLVAIARELFHGRTAAEIEAIDPEEIFRKLGFDQHIMPNRRNGFRAMVELLKSRAASL